MPTLTGQKVHDTYKFLIQINGGLGIPLTNIQDGDGNSSSVSLSATSMWVNGLLTMSVNNHTIRNAIPNSARKEGGIVYTINDQTTWQLLPSPWDGTDNDWAIFSNVNAYPLPSFSSFLINGQATTVIIPTTISGLVTFTWATNNSQNIVANSLIITDVTNNVILASGVADTGSKSITLPTPISHTSGQSNVWSISGTDTKGNVFTLTFTVLWLAVNNFTYYVRPGGNDSHTGLVDDDAHAFLTLQHAANIANLGDTVVVRAGTYSGFNIINTGILAARITFSADSGVNITTPVNIGGSLFGINGSGISYVTVQGFTVQPANGQPIWKYGIRLGGTPGNWVLGNIIQNNTVAMRVVNDATQNWDQLPIFTSWNDGLLVQNNTISGGWDSGIYTSNSARNYTIRGNTIFNIGGNGIHNNGDLSAGSPGINYRALIENNIIHDIGFGVGGQAISCDGLQDSRIQNNLIYNAHAKGISLYGTNAAEGCKRDVICNNTVYMLSGAYVAFRMNDLSDHNTIYNNIFFNPSSSNAWVDVEEASTTGTFIDYNVTSSVRLVGGSPRSDWTSTYGFDSHSSVSNAANTFYNIGGNNFHIKALSPALNTGINTLNTFTAPSLDIESNSRPFGGGYDIGSYENHATFLVVTNHVPTSSASNVSSGAVITFTFNEDINPSSIGFTLINNDNSSNITGTLSYNNGTFTSTFTPTSSLSGSTNFLATISAATAAVGGEILTDPVIWTFSTINNNPRLFSDSTTPGTLDFGDGATYTLGVYFYCDSNAHVVRIHFYKATLNTGTHIAGLWDSTGTLLGQKTFTGETSSGWQSVTFDTPIAITAGANYTAGVLMPNGHYSYDASYFDTGYTNGQLHVHSSPTRGSSFNSGSSLIYPNTNGGGNYWVDVEVTIP